MYVFVLACRMSARYDKPTAMTFSIACNVHIVAPHLIATDVKW